LKIGLIHEYHFQLISVSIIVDLLLTPA